MGRKAPANENKKSQQPEKKKVTLALQGGGAFGAFAWGVIDRLLEDERIEITGVSGSSAGAVNAVALAHGLDKGGPEEARKTMFEVWRNFAMDRMMFGKSEMGDRLQELNEAIQDMDVTGTLRRADSLTHHFMSAALGASPKAWAKYVRDMNLQGKLEENISFEDIRNAKDGIPVFVCATDLHGFVPKVFERDEMTADMVAASGAVPGIFPAVEIDGREYWDGVFSENPAMEPLKDCDGSDIIVIQTVPMQHDTSHPDTPFEEMFRQVQHGLNIGMRKDVENIQKDNARVKKDPEAAKKLGIKEIHTHMIKDDEHIPNMDLVDMHYTNWKHLRELHDIGYKAADQWLKDNFDKLGNESTFNAKVDTSHRTSHLKDHKAAPEKPARKKSGPAR